mmetsp:Transcript_20664/g.48776  ORF Transcript_20664/g.48776 Transcript_20664/m.48776 type:complete len:226 (+) Transcript_20664:319-996(+)
MFSFVVISQRPTDRPEANSFRFVFPPASWRRRRRRMVLVPPPTGDEVIPPRVELQRPRGVDAAELPAVDHSFPSVLEIRDLRRSRRRRRSRLLPTTRRPVRVFFNGAHHPGLGFEGTVADLPQEIVVGTDHWKGIIILHRGGAVVVVIAAKLLAPPQLSRVLQGSPVLPDAPGHAHSILVRVDQTFLPSSDRQHVVIRVPGGHVPNLLPLSLLLLRVGGGGRVVE